MPSRLSATIVTFEPDGALLQRAVATLRDSALRARDEGLLSGATLYLVDNGPGSSAPVVDTAAAAWPPALGPVEVLRGHGNVGYGRANNLVLAQIASDIHVVMNPDVALDPDAIPALLRAFDGHANVGLVAPAARDAAGRTLYLAKRMPSVFTLFLRGFAPAGLRERFRATLDHYELRDTLGNAYVEGIPLASGCFMPMRTALFRELGGFDPGYFMYFEDFDLSARLARKAPIAYAPSVRIVHEGGEASRKGGRHVRWFIASARRFFNRHGWRWR